MRKQEANAKKARTARWNKAEKPYFAECLTCALSCSMLIRFGKTSYDIMTCPKAHAGGPVFPYKYAEMKKEYEQQEEMRNGKEQTGEE